MSRGVERIEIQNLTDHAFDEIIDVRSPDEFAIDHLSGAINLPVLDSEERVRIGTIYKQESKFKATKLGASLVSKNIGGILASHFQDKEKGYRPMVYCWRGGQRSGSLATVLDSIGWETAVLEGGYREYRRHVIRDLEAKSNAMDLRIVNGLTGCGKTLILHAIAEQGGQVLDLEGLANHKGSVFGGDPAFPQPQQKRFESLIYDVLSEFDVSKPVYVEAESPKIGRLNIPIPFWKKMRSGRVSEIVASVEARTRYLLDDYEEWLSDPERVVETLDRLISFHGKARIAMWKEFCEKGEWAELISDLLVQHYDQNYNTGGTGHFDAAEKTFELSDHKPETIRSCAEFLMSDS